MASAASSSSSSSHEPSIPSPSNPTVSVAIPGELGGAPVQGSRVHPASRAMGRGSDTFISLLGQKDVDDLVERYEIDLSLFEVRVPCSGERASAPREGEIAVYQDALLENPMEDEDLSYVKGLLASFESEVHPPLARGQKKKEVVPSQGADTSKEERKKRKRKETDSSKKGVKSDPVQGPHGRGGPRERIPRTYRVPEL
ncbi:hypothetical protein J5N97_030042 [Dioscorea zingiberensis]|uniref:Uncharacterized protein n=1 Tax=Dioscorea zingiberensis TaxID=325984 RepID=A0A9D5BWX8_9LILI|nr:hypothetical protein J5N97_030042 [Dioscorea zingiberensis]